MAKVFTFFAMVCLLMSAKAYAAEDWCDKASKELGKELNYAEAKLIYFAEAALPAGTSKRKDISMEYGATFESADLGKFTAHIPSRWKDSNVPPDQLELAPPPVEMSPDSNYGFCYRKKALVGSKKLHYFIEVPETIMKLSNPR